jgi:hypothetical protein
MPIQLHSGILHLDELGWRAHGQMHQLLHLRLVSCRNQYRSRLSHHRRPNTRTSTLVAQLAEESLRRPDVQRRSLVRQPSFTTPHPASTLTSHHSTTIVSIVRLQSLVQFSSSTNPTYDNVPTAYWSVLEAFVGIFCVCMPALRRFLTNVFPRCFQSTQLDSNKYEQYDLDPNKVSDGTRKASKASVSFGGLRLGSGITKTTETRVESQKGEEDEIELVGMERGRGVVRDVGREDIWVGFGTEGVQGTRV